MLCIRKNSHAARRTDKGVTTVSLALLNLAGRAEWAVDIGVKIGNVDVPTGRPVLRSVELFPLAAAAPCGVARAGFCAPLRNEPSFTLLKLKLLASVVFFVRLLLLLRLWRRARHGG